MMPRLVPSARTRSAAPAALVLVFILRAGIAFAGCDFPAGGCIFRCHGTRDKADLCFDKCHVKQSCKPTFDTTACEHKCSSKCLSAQAKLLSKGCSCDPDVDPCN
jgi:hypothetical protein